MEPYIPKMSDAPALYGCLAIGFAFIVATFGGHVLQGAIAGAIIGLICSLVVIIGNTLETPYKQYLPMTVDNCTMQFNLTEADIKPRPEDPEDVFHLFKMSFMWFPAFGTTICVVVGLVVSFVVEICSRQPVQKKIHPSLIIPIFDRIFCCLPDRILKMFWCDIKYDEIKLDDSGCLVYPPLPVLYGTTEPVDDDETELQRNDTKDVTNNGDVTKPFDVNTTSEGRTKVDPEDKKTKEEEGIKAEFKKEEFKKEAETKREEEQEEQDSKQAEKEEDNGSEGGIDNPVFQVDKF
ncbi:hypothetical protein CAPTEDRAFT_216260 [Capitella teleta]|uniref:Uncharacterized protein n=1 Tax=Capitella teleta TaxID=283909 RepID=R7VJ28_CAPTE|nr:hypothetical protein CAPTEDRAFT_216260 [Capitella teleta]|eukprot:ELU18567.1 hypothetical protein CAPTEDRAFT_216260 [Capitella teleta]